MAALEILTKRSRIKCQDHKDQISNDEKLNERITENIVRDILKANQKKYSKVIIEEQKSENKRIEKLLKHASKSGLGGEVLSLSSLLMKFLTWLL